MKTTEQRNHICFGLGTVGRDMFYAFEANTLLYFLSDVLSLPVWVFAAASMILSVMRIFDALNDPITGLVIDNIRSPWGKFKPAILVGGVLSAFFSLILFSGIGEGWTFVIIFAVAYLLWDITYGVNDIGYWTLLPVLSSDQKQREKTGAFARICANIGMYIVMVAWQPVTSALGMLARLRKHLYRHVVGDQIFLDELAAKFVFRLARRGKTDLDFLKPDLAQKLEKFQLFFKAHRNDQSLIAVAQVHAAPHGRLFDARFFRPIHRHALRLEILFYVFVAISHNFLIDMKKSLSRRRAQMRCAFVKETKTFSAVPLYLMITHPLVL